jgi:hypothetical protein
MLNLCVLYAVITNYAAFMQMYVFFMQAICKFYAELYHCYEDFMEILAIFMHSSLCKYILRIFCKLSSYAHLMQFCKGL